MVRIMYATYYLFYEGSICKEENAAFYFLMACILFTKILKTMQYLKSCEDVTLHNKEVAHEKKTSPFQKINWTK